MQKKASPIGKADFRERKTRDVEMIFSDPKGKLSYTHTSASQKSEKVGTKSSFDQLVEEVKN